VREVHGRSFALVAGALLALAACGPVASPSPSVSVPSPSAPASAFESPLYGYSVELSGVWRPDPATEAWTGTETFGSDSANSDKFHSDRGTTIWAVAAPTTKTLDELVAERIADDAAENDCPTEAESDEDITVSGQPARLTTKHCPADAADGGALIVMATVLDQGDVYFFYFIYPVYLASDPNAIDAFTSFLDGVELP
jgi:hypothetical protein